MAKTNELSQDKQAQATKDSFNYEEWKAGFKFDSPEFLAEEVARKADQLADIRCGEYYARERAKVHRPQWDGSGTAGWTVEARPLYEPDWTENHEA